MDLNLLRAIFCFLLVFVSLIVGIYSVYELEEKEKACFELNKVKYCEDRDMELGTGIYGIFPKQREVCRDEKGNEMIINYKNTRHMCGDE